MKLLSMLQGAVSWCKRCPCNYAPPQVTFLSPVYADPHDLSYQIILVLMKVTGIRPRGCRNLIELGVSVADEYNG